MSLRDLARTLEALTPEESEQLEEMTVLWNPRPLSVSLYDLTRATDKYCMPAVYTVHRKNADEAVGDVLLETYCDEECDDDPMCAVTDKEDGKVDVAGTMKEMSSKMRPMSSVDLGYRKKPALVLFEHGCNRVLVEMKYRYESI